MKHSMKKGFFFISAIKDEPYGYETNTEKETLKYDDRTPSWCCLHNKKHDVQDVYVFFTLFASPFVGSTKRMQVVVVLVVLLYLLFFPLPSSLSILCSSPSFLQLLLFFTLFSFFSSFDVLQLPSCPLKVLRG